ncbi:MAG TPA: tetratricopeptide repeat protein [Gemmataceae bacterium]|nr:tetratricopeptide repeat protein [Gemmataceae bacterium]
MKVAMLWWLIPMALVLTGAMPADRAYDLVRQGNAACDRGKYEVALALYAQAEDSIPDPGLVAFNEGVALYQLAAANPEDPARLLHFHEAELHYRRCLTDATGARRPRALYNLANALVQQAGPRDVPRLKEAVALYQECIASPDIEPVTDEDARHNLGIARIRLQRAQAAKKSSSADPDEGDDGRPPLPRPSPGDGGFEAGSADPGSQSGGSPVATVPGDSRGTQGNAQQTEKTTPGEGGPPPIPDADKLVPMSPAETQDFVDRAAARIRDQQHKHWQQLTPPASRPALDW